MLKEIDTAGSILFLGSGFSGGARNIRGRKLPTGSELKHEFATLLGVDPKDYDLKTLADEVSSRPDLNLYQTLYQLFTVKTLQDCQSELLKLPWRRIYTTNYGDAIELAYHQTGLQRPASTMMTQSPESCRTDR